MPTLTKSNTETTIASAGNVLPAALACLRSLGYEVTLTNSGRLCKAIRANNVFIAEDALQLLGLVKLQAERGNDWRTSDAEVEDYLTFDNAHNVEASYERADVWEENGAVHLICVTKFSDPVELNTEEARQFAGRLNDAILKAE
jgi:hypothetical protein